MAGLQVYREAVGVPGQADFGHSLGFCHGAVADKTQAEGATGVFIGGIARGQANRVGAGCASPIDHPCVVGAGGRRPEGRGGTAVGGF